MDSPTRIFAPVLGQPCIFPMLGKIAHCGFPSPAQDFYSADDHLDLNKHLIARPAATYFVRVQGDSMQASGIFSGDLLVVDRSLNPSNGKIVVVFLDGETLVKRYCNQMGDINLHSDPSDRPPLKVLEGSDFLVWGVVLHG